MNLTLKKSIIAFTAGLTIVTAAADLSANTLSAAAATDKAASPFSKPVILNSTELQPGLNHKEMVYGKSDASAGFLVNIDFFTQKDDAEKLQSELKQKGCQTSIFTIHDRPQDDPESGPLGYMVRSDKFDSEQQAIDFQKKINAEGYLDARTVYSSETGEPATGPWKAHVLEVKPNEFKGRIASSLATEIIPGKEKLTEMSARSQALAGINGGYFVMGPADGTEGDLAGISMINGHLTSEAVNGRSSLILNRGSRAQIESLSTYSSVEAENGAMKRFDGLNRAPGLVRGCGGMDDAQTNNPKHDFTCTDNSELISFTSDYGETTPSGEGTEALINSEGEVVKVTDTRGSSIPSGGSVIAGTGEMADWIKDNLISGSKVKRKDSVKTAEKQLNISKDTSIINGGPRLLDDGDIRIPAKAEGFHHEDNAEFFYQFGVRRHPRTLAGIKPDGTVLFVTIDGRKPGQSIGANFNEAAQIMKSLGAVEAVNLDGGGSTAMTVNQSLVNSPSDQTGERPIGDAILMLPEQSK